MPTEVITQLRAYLDYASGDTVNDALVSSTPARQSTPRYRKGPVLAVLAGVLVLAVGVPALFFASDPTVASDPGEWSSVADVPLLISSGSIVEPLDDGLVVVEAESTTLVAFDGSTTPGERPPVNVPSGCCGSAVAIPVGDQLVIFDAYAPGTWLLNPETVSWEQVGDRPSTGDVLGSAVIGNQIYVVTASPRTGTANAEVAALDTKTWEWTGIEPVPTVIAVGGVTTDGQRLIVAGVQQNGNNIIVGESRQPEAYALRDGVWEELPDVPIDGQAATVAWVEDVGLLAWNYELDSALLNEDGSWVSTGPVPMEFSECYPHSKQVDSGVIALFCGQLAHFDATSRSWSPIATKLDAKYAATANAIYELAPVDGQTTLSIQPLPTAED
jgi:hypothetical protein